MSFEAFVIAAPGIALALTGLRYLTGIPGWVVLLIALGGVLAAVAVLAAREDWLDKQSAAEEQAEEYQ